MKKVIFYHDEVNPRTGKKETQLARTSTYI